MYILSLSQCSAYCQNLLNVRVECGVSASAFLLRLSSAECSFVTDAILLREIFLWKAGLLLHLICIIEHLDDCHSVLKFFIFNTEWQSSEVFCNETKLKVKKCNLQHSKLKKHFNSVYLVCLINWCHMRNENHKSTHLKKFSALHLLYFLSTSDSIPIVLEKRPIDRFTPQFRKHFGAVSNKHK